MFLTAASDLPFFMKIGQVVQDFPTRNNEEEEGGEGEGEECFHKNKNIYSLRVITSAKQQKVEPLPPRHVCFLKTRFSPALTFFQSVALRQPLSLRVESSLRHTLAEYK